MRGLVLEGGGARGAYHLGVVKAFLENGVTFDGFVGTSIGAVNAAALAQGEFDAAYELWSNMSMARVFDAEAEKLLEIGRAKISVAYLAEARGAVKNLVYGGGVDTSRMRAIITGVIDEDKIRASGKDFGLVTVSLSEHKAYELFLEDIPKGRLVNYIMASASFPGFKAEVIDGQFFIDGAFHDNCPAGMLVKKEYDEIIVVRTKAPGVIRRIKAPGAAVTVISPSENLGPVMQFDRETASASLTIGYHDGLRAVRGLAGKTYYIDAPSETECEAAIFALSDEVLSALAKAMRLTDGTPPRRLLFEQVIPQLAAYLRLPKRFSYTDFTIALLEWLIKQADAERYTIYPWDAFKKLAANVSPPKTRAIFGRQTRALLLLSAAVAKALNEPLK